MSYHYSCTHCGKKFELPEPQAKECPFCYWSSSVRREDEMEAEKQSKHRIGEVAGQAQSHGAGAGSSGVKLKFLARLILALGIAGGLVFSGYFVFQKFISRPMSSAQSLSIKFQKEEARKKSSQATGLAALSPIEKEALDRAVTITASPAPSQAEQEILQRVVPFETGWAESLPSPAWTLDRYQKMLQEQEGLYKMPFARSYRNKLEELFKSKYLPASEAFAKGDLLAARDRWMESLAFPLYSTDIKKHRAVALTMLRPFINDTLAKISAMNQSLADKDKRAKEQVLSAAYQDLAGLIAQKKWDEALASIAGMETLEKEVRQNSKLQTAPPQYPASFATIDQDIQRALLDLMSPKPSSVADLQPLQQDLVEKKEVLETFTEEYRKNATESYQSALALIREQKWDEAIQALESIRGPEVLQEDAARKAAILKKIAPPLDSSPETS